MARRVAVLAISPANGFSLFQYPESLFENGIPYKISAVPDTREIKTNSGTTLFADDMIANLKGHEDEFDALVLARGNAVPIFKDNAGKTRDVDLMEVIKAFGEKGRPVIGHCAVAMMFDFIEITTGKRLAIHPPAKPAIQTGRATDGKSEIDDNFYTARDGNTLWTMTPQLIEVLKG